MLRYLTLREYRAFKRQNFNFTRLNIFAGRNNSGKSSALSALNLLAQTTGVRELDSTPLLLNGPFDHLGTFIDVVHENIARRPLGVDLGFGRYDLRLDFKFRSQRKQIELQGFNLSTRGSEIFRYSSRKDAFDVYVEGQEITKAFPGIRKRRPTFRNFWPVSFLDLQDLRRLDEVKVSANDPALDSRERYFRLFRHLSMAGRELEQYFEEFESLSAFRDRPQRTYLYSGETARRVGVTGSNAALMLAADESRRGSEKNNLADSLSRWFRATGIAQDVFVKPLTSRHFEICIRSNDGSEHNICDVGFGCSQVLPVLIGGLHLQKNEANQKNRQSVFVVQEPEIHLHPNAQASLGSFFVEMARNGGQTFVETHSDNLILRVARHVAEGDLKPEDVAIFWVQDTGPERVKHISLTKDGSFSPEWPGGFFPQRHEESLALARAAFGDKPRTFDQLEFRYPEER
jgi:predicted ATPase